MAIDKLLPRDIDVDDKESAAMIELAMKQQQRLFPDDTFFNSTVAMATDNASSAHDIDENEGPDDIDLSMQTLLPSFDGDMEEAHATTETSSAPEQLVDLGGDGSATAQNWTDNMDDEEMLDNSKFTMQQLPFFDDNIEEADVQLEANSAPK